MKKWLHKLKHWKPIHLCWLFRKLHLPIPRYLVGGGSDFFLQGGRIANATRVWQAAQDVNVIDWDVTNDFIVAAMFETDAHSASTAFYLHWRNKTDGGSFTYLDSSGELTYNADTDLVHLNPVIHTEEGINARYPANHEDGKELEGSSLGACTLAKEYHEEWHWAVDCNNAHCGDEYEFAIYDSEAAAYVGTLASTITMAICPPVVTTLPVGNIRKTTAIGYGRMTNTGGATVSKRGICWNTTGNPDVNDSKSEETDSFDVGYFSRSMTGLTAGQHYYVKAYAYNSEGYGYGSQVEFDALPTDSEVLLPNAAGDENAISSQYPADSFPPADHWNKVDEDSSDDYDTHVWNSEVAYQRDLYNLPAHSGSGTIDKIVVHFRCAATSIADCHAKASIKSDSTTTDGAEKTFSQEDYSVYEDFSQEWVNNPADSQPWEWSDIDALQIGVSIESNIMMEYTYCTQVYVVVYYTPPVDITVYPDTLTLALTLETPTIVTEGPIDVGTAAIDRAGDAGPDTFIVKENPANATGVIDHVETWVYSGSGDFDVAAFEEVNGNTFTTRGYVEGLSATTGFNEWDAPGDFTAFNINEGDYIGMFMWMDTVQDPSGVGRWYTGFADNIPCENQGFAFASNSTISLYATGTEAGGVDITVYPDTLTLALTLETPTIVEGTGVTVLPNTLALIDTLEDPNTLYDFVVPVSSELSLAGTIETPDALFDYIISVSEQALTASVETPTINFDFVISVSVQALAGSLNAPSISGDALVTPATLSLARTLYGSDVAITGDVTVTPNALPLSATLEAPTVNLDFVISVSAQALTESLETPGVSGEAIIIPSVLALTGSIEAATITGEAIIVPSVLALTGSIEAATISGDANITPSAFALIGTLHDPTIVLEGAGVIVYPDAIAITGILQTPSIIGEASILVVTLELTGDLPAPSVLFDYVHSVVALALRLAFQAPDLGMVKRVRPITDWQKEDKPTTSFQKKDKPSTDWEKVDKPATSYQKKDKPSTDWGKR